MLRIFNAFPRFLLRPSIISSLTKFLAPSCVYLLTPLYLCTEKTIIK